MPQLSRPRIFGDSPGRQYSRNRHLLDTEMGLGMQTSGGSPYLSAKRIGIGYDPGVTPVSKPGTIRVVTRSADFTCERSENGHQRKTGCQY
jgi:hypothetical protein